MVDDLLDVYIEPNISSLAEESYLDAETADVYFIFNSGGRKKNKRNVRIPAHKIFLKLRSDVFHAMFYGEMKEIGDIQIVDAFADVFREFLKLFYFDAPIIEMAHVPGVLELVRKYNVSGCLDYFDRFLAGSITSDKVCWIYDLSLEFKMSLTQSSCERQISLSASEIFQSSDFLERSYETVLEIVSLDKFACEEYTIFKACITWAQGECIRKGMDHTKLINLRNQLRDILYQIRFRSMHSTQLGDVIREYHSLFANNELADIGLLALKHSDPETLISEKYRTNAWHDGALLSCKFFDGVERRLNELKCLESVTFSSDKRIILRQIKLGNLYVNNIKVKIYERANLKLQIIKKLNDTEEQIIYGHDCPNESAEFGYWFSLPKMIFIEPLVNYEIRLEYWDITDNKYFAHGRNSSEVVTRKSDGKGSFTFNVSGSANVICGMKFVDFFKMNKNNNSTKAESDYSGI